MEAYIGSIMLFAGNFAPRGWMLCAGQTLAIAQYQALFSLLGTYYGGNGTTTFMLPDLRSRVPVGAGQGNGLTNWNLGESQGVENVALLSTQMPAHNHTVNVGTSAANSPAASNNYLAVANANLSGDPVTVNTYNGTPNATLAANSLSIAGQGQPHNNLQPSLALNYIICLEGIYPSRN
jgi:microcystin-dependent protein